MRKKMLNSTFLTDNLDAQPNFRVPGQEIDDNNDVIVFDSEINESNLTDSAEGAEITNDSEQEITFTTQIPRFYKENSRSADKFSNDTSDPVFVTPPVPQKQNKQLRASYQPKIEPEYEEEVQSAIQSLVEGESPYNFEPEVLNKVVPLLKNLKLQAVQNKTYLVAEKYKRIAVEATRAIHIKSFSNQCTEKVSELLAKRQEAQAELDFVNEEWKKRFENLESQITTQQNHNLQKQQRELEQFDMNASDNLNKLSFKPSPNTIEARKKEMGLVANEQYVAADKARRIADSLEDVQQEKIKQRAINELTRARNQLLGKHKKQNLIFNQWAEERISEFQKAREEEVSAADQRVQNYDKILRLIEQRGFAPNPNLGFTTKKVNRKDALKAVRQAICLPNIHTPQPVNRNKCTVMKYRPTTAFSQSKMRMNQ